MIDMRIRGAGSTSARRKFERGVDQVKALLDEIADFEECEDAVSIDVRPRQAEETMIEVACFAKLIRPLPEHWPLLAGEAIQNLRASLDHFVFSAAGGSNLRTQFPICDSRKGFRSAIARKHLEGVPETIRILIEDVQPFANSDNAVHNGDSHHLAELRDLSNEDKHRVLATVLFAVRHEWLGVPKRANAGWIKFATRSEIKREEFELSSFVVHATDPIDISEVVPGFKFHVEIERKDPRMLTAIARAVHRVLWECEHGEPLSPLAEYPI